MGNRVQYNAPKSINPVLNDIMFSNSKIRGRSACFYLQVNLVSYIAVKNRVQIASIMESLNPKTEKNRTAEQPALKNGEVKNR